MVHAVRCPPISPEKPGLQLHSATLLLQAVKVEPKGQFVHACVPLVALNLPAGHTGQVPDTPVVPTSQMQASPDVLPTGDMDEAGQLRQFDNLNWLLQVLVGQAVQPKLATLVYPVLHWQSDSTVLPVEELELDGHWVHVSDPDVVLYCPPAHGEHSPPPGPV